MMVDRRAELPLAMAAELLARVREAVRLLDSDGTKAQIRNALDQSDRSPTFRSRKAAVMEETVRSCGGNLTEAARTLGVSRTTVYRTLRRVDGVKTECAG